MTFLQYIVVVVVYYKIQPHIEAFKLLLNYCIRKHGVVHTKEMKDSDG